MKQKPTILLLFAVLSLLLLGLPATATPPDKPRLLVLTDIGGDPDDIQSLRRLLLYANEFHLEGVIATSTHGPAGQRQKGVYHIFENHIHDAVDDYEKVVNNLSLHRDGYPSAAQLRSIVKKGQANRGVLNLSPGRSTEGSQHIIAMVDATTEPLHISIWGGAHDLAQALLDVKATREPEVLNEFISRIRVYAIGDQDRNHGSEKGTGQWILENFPGIWYIEAGPSWLADVASGGYRGIYQNDSPTDDKDVKPLVRPGLELNQGEWVKENVLKWGPLGERYPPLVVHHPKSGRNTAGVKEGDTPSWFYLLPHGLNDPSHPEWGGWGGRFEHVGARWYTDAQDDHWSGSPDGALRRKWTVARWREAYQNDFAARMQWCVLNVKQANHNPVAVIDGDDSGKVLTLKVRKGTSVTLDAGLSHDPDGDAIAFRWWLYHEASSTIAALRNDTGKTVTVELPAYTQPGEVHLVLEVTDDRTPRLFSYRRVILEVIP